ncbi:MAG: hypothetical protein KF690_06860 [Bacteroidetes bacterium]|nr:hypothetical protein [Bacteroidota bacterium]
MRIFEKTGMMNLSLEKIQEKDLLEVARKAIKQPVEYVEMRDISEEWDFIELKVTVYFLPDVIENKLKVDDLKAIKTAIQEYVRAMYPREQPFVHFRFQRTQINQRD